MSWQVNYLANQLLLLLLLQSMDKEQGRILFIGSWTHEYSQILSSIVHRGINIHSVEDKRNEIQQTHFTDRKWSTFPGPEPLAKGTWSTPQQDPTRYNSFRRYGFCKLCEVMFMLFHSYAQNTFPALFWLTERTGTNLLLGLVTIRSFLTSLSSALTPELCLQDLCAEDHGYYPSSL